LPNSTKSSLTMHNNFVVELMFGFSRCLTAIIFGRRRIQATCDLGFAARNNQCGPVRVECEFTSLHFELVQVASGAEEVFGKSGTTDVVG